MKKMMFILCQMVATLALSQPTITSMTIYTGNTGAAVGIRGTGFNTTAANNIVYFGATKATVSSSTATTVNVTVPIGATFQPVSVLNTGTALSGYSLRSFLPSFNSTTYVTGAIHFDTKVDFSTTSSNAYGVVMADLDGDGKPDMVATNNAGTSISVYRNTSSSGSITSGSFASPVTFTTGSNPAYLKVADLDNDGKPEIIVANTGSGTVSVFRNTATSGSISSSSFASKVDFSAGSNVFDIAVADFDGDGKPDIAVTNSISSANTISVLRNTSSTGTISSSSFASAVTFATGSIPVKIVAADFDGDGKPDIAVTNNSSNSISVFRNTASSGSITTSSFASKVDFTTGTNPRGIFAADMDNDGKFDIVVTNRTSNNISIFHNTASSGAITSSSFESQDTFTAGTTPYDVAMGDLDGNGKPDIIVTNFGATSISVFRNIGSTGSITSSTFTAKKDFTTGGTGGPYGLAICDLDGDGKADIVIANSNSSGSVSVLHNNILMPIANAGTVCLGSTLALGDSITGGTWSSNATGIATISTTGVVTPVSGGMAIVTYTVTGSYDTALITVNARPTIASITPSVTSICVGSPLTLTAGSVTGAGTITSYNWTGPNSYLANGAATTAVLTPTATAASGVYSLSVTYPGAGCTSTAVTSASITVNPAPSAGTISGIASCCVGSTTILTDLAAGGTWSSSNTAIATVNSGVVTGIAAGTANISYTVTSGCGTAYAIANVAVNAMQWTGNLSTDWNTATNWSCGIVPGATDNITIPSGTLFAPAIAAAASGTVRNLTIASGAVITANAGASLNVKGDLNNSGSINGSGNIKLNGTTAQMINGSTNVNNLELNNSAGATIQSGAKLTIKNTLTITSGTLATNDSLVLYSDSAGTARVAPIPSSGAAISGTVKVMQYIGGGYRRYRFWSHPFSSYIGLSQLENYIDITGAGSASNGFTTTASNAPSAFWYNPMLGNDSLAYDPGWRAFTSAYTTADSNRLHQYQGLRIFFRGAKGEGLGYNSYTPSAVTIAQCGQLNQGTQKVSMTKGIYSHQDYNMIGNPYASPVDIGTVIYNAKVAGRITGSAYYVWNTYLGAAGQYQAIPVNTVTAIPYYLQANCAFQVRAAHNGDTLTFAESNKGTTATASLMREQQDYTRLAIYDAKYHLYDMLYLDFNATASDREDDRDALKLTGLDFSFYSKSADNNKLAIDSRPYEKGKIIPLGISSNYVQDYIIKAETIAVPEGGKLYLMDKLLKQNILLKQGTEYRFTVTADKTAQGEDRFELGAEPADIATANNKGLLVTMTPNPATDIVHISFTQGNEKTVKLRIVNLSGVSVYNQDLGTGLSGKLKVPLNGLPTGVYLVELTSGDEHVVQRLIKE